MYCSYCKEEGLSRCVCTLSMEASEQNYKGKGLYKLNDREVNAESDYHIGQFAYEGNHRSMVDDDDDILRIDEADAINYINEMDDSGQFSEGGKIDRHNCEYLLPLLSDSMIAVPQQFDAIDLEDGRFVEVKYLGRVSEARYLFLKQRNYVTLSRNQANFMKAFPELFKIVVFANVWNSQERIREIRCYMVHDYDVIDENNIYDNDDRQKALITELYEGNLVEDVPSVYTI